jgi:hypothetical protein
LLASSASLLSTPTALSAGESNSPKSLTKPLTSQQSYDFKGIPLGISIDEFRRIKYPDANDSQKIDIICPGDKVGGYVGNQDKVDLSITPTEDEKAVGVVECAFFWGYEVQTLNVTGAHGKLDWTRFLFARAPVDETVRLYRITFEADAQLTSFIVEALTDKFGQPSDVQRGLVQNAFGAKFAHVQYMWSDGTSSITVESPSFTTEKMTAVYSFDRLMAHVRSAIEAKRRSIKNRI